MRNAAYFAYYEHPAVVRAIQGLGQPYQAMPGAKGYPLPAFNLEHDRPRHGRGYYIRTEDVKPLDLGAWRKVSMGARDDIADVLVIGSGATGSIAAKVLGEAGLRVVCLEQGGWIEPKDHPHYSPDWQWQRRSRWSADVNVRKGNDDDFPVRSNSSQVLMWNGVGGSTNVYGALWPRYRPSDFRKGTEHGLQPDWPISYEDLSTYYDRADRLVGVSGLAGDPAMPPSDDYPTPPLPMQAASRRLAQAFDRLDWHWWPVPAGVISRNYDGRLACHGCGICNGLPARVDEQVLDLGLAEGTGGRRRVAHLRTRDLDREGPLGSGDRCGLHRPQYRPRAPPAAEVVILAANGVGTPRLLLASDNLANSSDQVGRNLLHHTLVACEMWVDEPLAAHTGYVAALISRQFAESDLSRGFVNGFNFNCVTTAALASRRSAFCPTRTRLGVLGIISGSLAISATASACSAIGDDLPHPDNRITLSPIERDADGVPVAAAPLRAA